MKFFNYLPVWASADDQCAVPTGELCPCTGPIQATDKGVMIPHVDSLGNDDVATSWKAWHLQCFRIALGI